MDAVGSERAALLADLVDGPTALLFAGTRPERTSTLILMHTAAKLVASDDYPIGMPAEVAEALLAQIDQSQGTDAMAAMLIQAPTLVVHRKDFPIIPSEHARDLAERLPGAKLVELAGAD